MLLIETFLRETKKRGLGCFTSTAVKKGAKIHKEESLIDREIDAIYVKKGSMEHEFLLKYASFNKETNRFYLCGDNARFINHSKTPNIIPDGIYLIATRDIEIGEELLIDYREICDIEKESLTFEEV